jgi:hypothetical protein
MSSFHAKVLHLALAGLLTSVVLSLVGCGGSSQGSEASGQTGRVRVEWQQPSGEADKHGYEALRAAESQTLANEVRRTFELPGPLTVTAVNGTGQPAYDPETDSVTIPYGFAALVSEVVGNTSSSMSRRETSERIAAVIQLILEHELGLALIGGYELQVGNQQQAADEIATLLLLRTKTGAKYGADAAIFFANFTDSAEPRTLVSFAEAHGFDLRHSLDTLCWVAGSSKQALKEVGEIGAIGVGNCPKEFEQLSGRVGRELERHLKAGASLAPEE